MSLTLNAASFGALSLNISTVIYCIYYIPQLFHNRHAEFLIQLSPKMHYLFLLSMCCDLTYGIGMGLPWQYRLVSLVVVSVLMVQHWQLAHINRVKIHHLGPFILGVLLSLLIPSQAKLFMIFGFSTTLLNAVHFWPQIRYQQQNKNAQALSIYYLLFHSALALLDLSSALLLNWPLPSKIGASLSLANGGILILQYTLYRHNTLKSVRCA